MKRVVIVIVAAVLLVLGAQVVGYYVALNSDAYAAASRFVLSDQKLGQQIGRVAKTSLAPFDAEIRFTPNTGLAKFVVTADTSSGTHKVAVRLEKRGNDWHVLDSAVVS